MLEKQLATLDEMLALHECERRRLTDQLAALNHRACQLARGARGALQQQQETFAREAVQLELHTEEEITRTERVVAAHQTRLHELQTTRHTLDARRRELAHHLELLALSPDSPHDVRLTTLLKLADEQLRATTAKRRAIIALGDDELTEQIIRLEHPADPIEQRLGVLRAELGLPAPDGKPPAV